MLLVCCRWWVIARLQKHNCWQKNSRSTPRTLAIIFLTAMSLCFVFHAMPMWLKMFMRWRWYWKRELSLSTTLRFQWKRRSMRRKFWLRKILDSLMHRFPVVWKARAMASFLSWWVVLTKISKKYDQCWVFMQQKLPIWAEREQGRLLKPSIRYWWLVSHKPFAKVWRSAKN